jgi:L-ribulose-5-phosphate 4-epimerase
MLDVLKELVWKANVDLVREGLVTLTWGNVSGFDSEHELVVIKPSGVAYGELRPEHMVIVDMSGKVVEGGLRPSSDTPTHLHLYKTFKTIKGITHSHSPSATIFAQACREIPCFGTTHADHFHGPVPVTRPLTEQEVAQDYELNTGRVIAERFQDLDPVAVPGVLVAQHGPFTWGHDAGESVRNSVALEMIARMAAGTLQVAPGTVPIPPYLLDQHYFRKHGPKATYGQGTPKQG